MWKKGKQLGLVYIGVWNVFLDKVIHLSVPSLLSSSLTLTCFSRHNISHHLLFKYYHVSVSLDYLCPLDSTYFLVICASVYTTFSLCTFKIVVSLWGFEFSLHMSMCLEETSANCTGTFRSAGRVGVTMRRNGSTPHLRQMKKELQHAVFLQDRQCFSVDNIFLHKWLLWLYHNTVCCLCYLFEHCIMYHLVWQEVFIVSLSFEDLFHINDCVL